MNNVREWYLNGTVVPSKQNTVVMDAYEVSDALKDKLNAILADEFLAYVNYKMCEVSMKGNKQSLLERLAQQHGLDELDDHYQNLVDWMQSKGLKVVTSIKDMEKITNCTVFEIKDGMHTSEIVDILIKSEEEAIAAYEKVLDDEAVKYDLREMLARFLSDERKHLKSLNDAKAEMKKCA